MMVIHDHLSVIRHPRAPEAIYNLHPDQNIVRVSQVIQMDRLKEKKKAIDAERILIKREIESKRDGRYGARKKENNLIEPISAVRKLSCDCDITVVEIHL